MSLTRINNIKGSYILIIQLESEITIQVGKLGRIMFDCGWYAYSGSAMNGIGARIGRHLRHNKKFHWHIDFLLDHAVVDSVYTVESTRRLECVIANGLGFTLDSVPGFGCSDCRCESHLYHHHNRDMLTAAVEAGLAGQGFVLNHRDSVNSLFPVMGMNVRRYVGT